jgi:hypothetical protein
VVVPFVATLAGAALPAGNDGSSSESSLSESSSLSLSFTGFARDLVGGCFEGTALETGLVAPVLVAGAVVAGSFSDSLSLDSEEELALAGTALDCRKRVNFISCDQNVVNRTFPFVTGSLCAGWSSSEEDWDDSPLDPSFFFPFLTTSFCAYSTYMYEKDIRWVRLLTRARISFEEIGALCFALGIVATGFLKSTAFLLTLALTSVLAVLTDFFSDFFSAFLSDLPIVEEDQSQGWSRV